MILVNFMNHKPGKFFGTVFQGGNNKKRESTTLIFWGEGVGMAADIFQRILNSLCVFRKYAKRVLTWSENTSKGVVGWCCGGVVLIFFARNS
jgi:hypothetical protein